MQLTDRKKAMLHVSYEEAVSLMANGLALYIPPEDAEKLARIFADNSADGVHSHGMIRFPPYINDMRNGICDPSVRQAEFVSGFGGLEVWDAHFGVGPLIAEQVSGHAAELAKTHLVPTGDTVMTEDECTHVKLRKLTFTREDAKRYLYSIDHRRRVITWEDIKVNIFV